MNTSAAWRDDLGVIKIDEEAASFMNNEVVGTKVSV
jgi:hypothetical protein